MDHDVVIECLGKVEQGLEHLVVDLDELERLVGGLLGLGGDDRHLFVLVTDEVLENQTVVGTRLRIALAGNGKTALGNVLVGVDAHDTGHLQARDVSIERILARAYGLRLSLTMSAPAGTISPV